MGKLYFIKGIGDNSRQMFIKEANPETGELVFTDRSSEGKDYGGTYFTNAQKNYLQFHFIEQFPELKGLKIWDDD